MQRLLGLIGLEDVNGAPRDEPAAELAVLLCNFVRLIDRGFGYQQLAWAKADELVNYSRLVAHLHPKLAGAKLGGGQAHLLVLGADGSEVIVLADLEQGFVGERSGGDDPHNFAPNHALGLAGVFDLFADGHFVAGFDQARQISLEGVIGDAGQGDGVLAFAAGGQGQAQDAGGGLGVVVEHLIEVAHAEEQDGIGHLRLLVGVLAHGGG